jgi:hypothetical protein
MQRLVLMLVLLGLISSAGLFAYLLNPSDSLDSNYQANSLEPNTVAIDRDVVVSESQRSEIGSFEQRSEQREASASSLPESAPVARWMREATGENPVERAAAITALARAPKSFAVPVLQKIVGAGADGDREQALISLRVLALEQGDADSVIRDTLRLAIYDGDDYMVANAQAALEEIEHNLDESVNGLR